MNTYKKDEDLTVSDNELIVALALLFLTFFVPGGLWVAGFACAMPLVLGIG